MLEVTLDPMMSDQLIKVGNKFATSQDSSSRLDIFSDVPLHSPHELLPKHKTVVIRRQAPDKNVVMLMVFKDLET